MTDNANSISDNNTDVTDSGSNDIAATLSNLKNGNLVKYQQQGKLDEKDAIFLNWIETAEPQDVTPAGKVVLKKGKYVFKIDASSLESIELRTTKGPKTTDSPGKQVADNPDILRRLEAAERNVAKLTKVLRILTLRLTEFERSE